MQLQWCRCDYDEYPPENTPVWTTDYKTVRKGSWQIGGATIPLEEGSWKDEHGQPTAVLAWVPIEESPDKPPDLPPEPNRDPGRFDGVWGTDEENDSNWRKE